MPKKENLDNVEAEERRHWRDRRAGSDRRNAVRLTLTSGDYRRGQPRRSADVAGELVDGDVWWNKSSTQFE